MTISYKKLWKLLIDKDMLKKDLALKAGISPASIAKLGKNEHVNTDILVKICIALKCDISDIADIVNDVSRLLDSEGCNIYIKKKNLAV